jgi:hypothetical protein
MTVVKRVRDPVFNHIPLTSYRRAVLVELAKCPNGTAPINGVMPGAHLATLVAMGLAEKLAPDALGDIRYAINVAGLRAREGKR